MLAHGELAVADYVPEGVEQVALGIAVGIAAAGGGGLAVGVDVQQRVGGGEGGLVRGWIVGMGGQKAFEHLPGPLDQHHAVDLLLAELGVLGGLGRRGVDSLRQGVIGGGDVALRRILPQQPSHDVDAAEELALRLEKAGHGAFAGEAALDRRAKHEVTPFKLADRVVGGADLQIFSKGMFSAGHFSRTISK